MNSAKPDIPGFDFVEVMNSDEAFQLEILHYKQTYGGQRLLISWGLSTYTQPVIPGHEKWMHTEVYMLLPEYWDFQKGTWPLQWLERIAVVPIKNATWFGVGDTLPAGNPPQDLSEKFKARYFILSEPILLESTFAEFKNEAGFNVLAVIPVYQKEFDYKLQYSSTMLLQRLQENSITELIDEFRLPVARRKIMGIF